MLLLSCLVSRSSRNKTNCLKLFIWKYRCQNWRTVQRMASAADAGVHINRLAKEKSPYLLQHANNPVDWYPWGEEAFEKSKTENKPIFLSVGYSTCHWCHVMERESFMSAEVAQILNTSFVPIKVDREERPDVDKVYMTFIQVTSGGGGWPMSVWLTPDLKPFLGGTYFPVEDHNGRPGFKTVLKSISKQWELNRDKINLQGNAIIEAIQQHMAKAYAGFKIPGEECYEKLYEELSSAYDVDNGGFSSSPKFPQPCIFNFLLKFHCLDPKSSAGRHALVMTRKTLDGMEKGGIHDHVGQGFHRYSTDQSWHVPHFEKMLYDQSQLAVIYLDAYQVTKDERYAEIARDILLYVMRDLSHKRGGFFSAEDADSLPTDNDTQKKEGAFYVWTQEEINNILSEPVKQDSNTKLSEVFSKHYAVSKNGNVRPHQDPHGDLKNKNILIVRGSLEKTAKEFNLTVSETSEALSKGRAMLFEERKKHPSPHLDDKMITAWNGLMISGFARAAQVLNEDVYLKRALKAANFVKTHLFEESSGKLLRSCYQNEDEIVNVSPPVYGFSEDYAYMICSLLDLYEASFDEQWLLWAESLQHKQDELFWDNSGGGYFQTENSESNLVLRLKEDMDAAEPSASSVSVHNLLRLSGFLDSKRFREKAEWVLSAYEGHLSKIPLALPGMMSGFLLQQMTNKQIIIAGDRDGEDTKKLLQCVHSMFIPNKVLIVHDGNSESHLASKLSILNSLKRVNDQATAYVCVNYTCDIPVTTAEDLFKVLTGSASVW